MNPLYSVGQRVAVFVMHPITNSIRCVLPETTILAIDEKKVGEIFEDEKGLRESRFHEIIYQVDGTDYWVVEKYLRPLNDGDYEPFAVREMEKEK